MRKDNCPRAFAADQNGRVEDIEMSTVGGFAQIKIDQAGASLIGVLERPYGLSGLLKTPSAIAR